MAPPATPAIPLDAIDRRLIAELVTDGRASYATLAVLVGMSETAVRARVQRLLERGLVSVTGRVHPHTAGRDVAALAMLRIDGPASEVAKYLVTVEDLSFVVCTTGRWGVLVEIRCHDVERLTIALDVLRAAPGVRGLETLTILEYAKQDWSGLVDRDLSRDVPTALREPHPAEALDAVDRILIERLLADGRATYAELAPAVGLSQTAVRARVQRLLDDNIVVVQARADSAALGVWPFAAAFVSVTVPVSPIVERLAKMPQVTMVAVASGRYDIVCEVWSADNADLLATLDELRTIDGIGCIESANYLEVTKETYVPTYEI